MKSHGSVEQYTFRSWLEIHLLRIREKFETKSSLILRLINKAIKFAEQRAIFQSTAQQLTWQFSKQGINQNQFNTDLLNSTYSTMLSIDDRPDFNEVDKILSNCATVEMLEADICLGVILETRCHNLLEKVVVDFVSQTGCKVQLFHGRSNLDFILASKIKGLISDGMVFLQLLNTEELNAKTYNAIFLSRRFWLSLMSRKKIFVFQSDSMFCSSSKKSLQNFLSFDYVGSWWFRTRPIGIKVDGGNGGFSIRDWQLSIECIQRFEGKRWPGGEDGYFAFHIDLIGGRIARGHECAKFSTQYRFLFKSFGCHNIACLNNDEQRDFLKYCPEAIALLN